MLVVSGFLVVPLTVTAPIDVRLVALLVLALSALPGRRQQWLKFGMAGTDLPRFGVLLTPLSCCACVFFICVTLCMKYAHAFAFSTVTLSFVPILRLQRRLAPVSVCS
jgi:hypothetical protein